MVVLLRAATLALAALAVAALPLGAAAKECPCISLLLLVSPDRPLAGEIVELKAYLTSYAPGFPPQPVIYRADDVRFEVEGSALHARSTLEARRDQFDRYVARFRAARPGEFSVAVLAGDLRFGGAFAGSHFRYAVREREARNAPADTAPQSFVGAGTAAPLLLLAALVAGLAAFRRLRSAEQARTG